MNNKFFNFCFHPETETESREREERLSLGLLDADVPSVETITLTSVFAENQQPFFWPHHFPSVEKQAKMYCKCKKLQNKQNQIGHAAIVDRRGRGRSDVRFNLRCSAWKDLLQRPTHPGNGRTDFLKLWNLVRWCVLSLEWSRVKIPLPSPCQISTSSGIWHPQAAPTGAES